MFGVACHCQLSRWLCSGECHPTLPTASIEKYDVGSWLVSLSHQMLHTRVAEGLTVTALWVLNLFSPSLVVLNLPASDFFFLSSRVDRITVLSDFLNHSSCINFSFPSPLASLCYKKKWLKQYFLWWDL